MPITHLSLVNQKLAYASAILNLLSSPLIKPKVDKKLERQALVDAAVFHLMMALHFYLRELANHHHIKNLSSINSVQELVTALQQSDKASSESSELLSLVQTGDTWLNQLTSYYSQLSASLEKPKEKKAFRKENLIDVVEIDEAPLLQLTPELLVSWLESFRALVVRQRETSAEY